MKQFNRKQMAAIEIIADFPIFIVTFYWVKLKKKLKL